MITKMTHILGKQSKLQIKNFQGFLLSFTKFYSKYLEHLCLWKLCLVRIYGGQECQRMWFSGHSPMHGLIIKCRQSLWWPLEALSRSKHPRYHCQWKPCLLPKADQEKASHWWQSTGEKCKLSGNSRHEQSPSHIDCPSKEKVVEPSIPAATRPQG